MKDLFYRPAVFMIFLALMLLFPPTGYGEEPAKSAGHHLKYSVSEGNDVTVVDAMTPYDGNPKARAAFLLWFKRGFKTVLTGGQPLMIEWQDSPEGRAGQRGYDFGMDEAVRYGKNRGTAGPPPYTALILPGP